MDKKEIKRLFENIKQGFLNGLGFSMGATIGFAIVSTIIVNIIRAGGGLPLIGNFFASLVEATQLALTSRH